MKVKTGCRLHMGLIDLNGGIGRVDGGIGLSLDYPGMTILGELNQSTEVAGQMSDRVLEAIRLVLDEIDGRPVRLEIESHIPQHVGLGSGTQVALAAATITARLNGVDLSVRRLAEITNRGGTSGIGTAAYEMGGFILDGGHNFAEKDEFIPSSVSEVDPPPVLARYKFPNWKIAVFMPEGTGAHGRQEFDVFEEACPIEDEEVEKLCRVILMKLLPSIKTPNFALFKDAIESIQYLGFKHEELKRQPESERIIRKLNRNGYAAGMSSLGPAVYAIHPDEIDQSLIDCRSFLTEIDRNGATIVDGP